VNYIYKNDFLTVPSEITLTNGATATIVDEALQLQTTTSAKALFKGNFTENLSGVVVYETKVKSSNTSTFLNAQFLYAGSTPILSVALSGGNIVYHNGSGWQTIVPYQANTWIVIKSEVHIGLGTFDLYINDTLYENLSLRTVGILENSINNFNNIGIDSRENVTFTFDYMYLYNK